MEDDANLNAQIHRTRAAAHRMAASAHDLSATAIAMAASMKKVVDIQTAAEAQQVAAHPDLAELNVRLDGFYGEAGE
ncbi:MULTISPECIES: hypothetical protein [Streptomyces]|uniref:hypothetical protein n=1 Tax=Streptomyces TaxID=1883 RepID=UPI002E28D2A6|nr:MULTISPECIES: hypothetical protein [Streptomyces]